jgi:hypothetical protein
MFFDHYKKLFKNDINYIYIIKLTIINELYNINNVMERFKYNMNTKLCSICYNDIINNVVILACCQQIMCEICSIKSTFKNELQKFDVLLGICPFCKNILELENDLLLTNININILTSLKQSKLIHTNKKSIINIIKHIINNKNPKFINKIHESNFLYENLNDRYVFSKFLNKKNKNFIITLNNHKEFKNIIEKIQLYNIDYFILNPNINFFDILNLNDPNKLFIINLTPHTYTNFILNIINKFNKFIITNFIFINPKNNMFLKNIIFKLQTYVNVFILNTI